MWGNFFLWDTPVYIGNESILSHIYVWGKSHWSVRNYGLNGAISQYVKPETNKIDFKLYFELFEKKL